MTRALRRLLRRAGGAIRSPVGRRVACQEQARCRPTTYKLVAEDEDEEPEQQTEAKDELESASGPSQSFPKAGEKGSQV